MNRRRFFTTAGTLAASASAADKPAALGGTPVRAPLTRQWPVFDALEEKAVLAVLRSGKWWRGGGQTVSTFEQRYAELTGARHCLAAANGTSSLLIALGALDIGPGDEVILPPYTFVATLNVILARHAMPVFVDSNIETFQIDATKVEAAVTPKTRLLLPVHLGGAAADLDTLLAAGKRRNVPVLEDACQAHLGEWRGRKLGSLGLGGCFSFQASKNLNSGEGGALLTSDSAFFQRASAFHNNSRSIHRNDLDFTYAGPGLNLRMTEFQAALLVSQMTRIEQQAKQRESNAQYLTGMLEQIQGIRPARLHEGCTRNAYHLYMFRYDKQAFANLPKAKFLKALSAEGIPASGGYTPLNEEPLIRNALESRGYKRVYSDAELKSWHERNRCPRNNQLCQEAVWLTQTMLLGPRSDMEQIAEAIRKIQRHASQLA